MFVVAARQHNCPLEDEENGQVHVRVVIDPVAWWGTEHVIGRWVNDWTRVCHAIPGQADGGKRRGVRGHVSPELQLDASTSAWFG